MKTLNKIGIIICVIGFIFTQSLNAEDAKLDSIYNNLCQILLNKNGYDVDLYETNMARDKLYIVNLLNEADNTNSELGCENIDLTQQIGVYQYFCKGLDPKFSNLLVVHHGNFHVLSMNDTALIVRFLLLLHEEYPLEISSELINNIIPKILPKNSLYYKIEDDIKVWDMCPR